MDAKEYLQQAYVLDRRIREDKLELERLRELAVAVPSALTRGGWAHGPAADRVGGIVAEIDELEGRIREEVSRYAELRDELNIRIDQLEDQRLRLVLRLRYIGLWPWPAIAEELGLGLRWVYRLHGLALQEMLANHQDPW